MEKWWKWKIDFSFNLIRSPCGWWLTLGGIIKYWVSVFFVFLVPRVEKRTTMVGSVRLPLTIIILRHSLAALSAALRLLWVRWSVALRPVLPLLQTRFQCIELLECAQHTVPSPTIIDMLIEEIWIVGFTSPYLVWLEIAAPFKQIWSAAWQFPL
jgi:hypothetical protein